MKGHPCTQMNTLKNEQYLKYCEQKKDYQRKAEKMKKKRNPIYIVMALMVMLALGTIAAYAAAELQPATPYAGTKEATVTVEKIWNSEDPDAGSIPEKVYVELEIMADETVVGHRDVELKKDNGYKTVITDLPSFYYNSDFETFGPSYKAVGEYIEDKDGNKISLSDRYAMECSDTTTTSIYDDFHLGPFNGGSFHAYNHEVKIVNTEKEPLYNIKGKVIWKNIPEEDRPETVRVELLKNNRPCDSAEADADADWNYEFPPVEGNPEEYSVNADVPGFIATIDGYNIICSREEASESEETESFIPTFIKKFFAQMTPKRQITSIKVSDLSRFPT